MAFLLGIVFIGLDVQQCIKLGVGQVGDGIEGGGEVHVAQCCKAVVRGLEAFLLGLLLFDALLKVKTTEHNAKKAAQERADRGRTRKELSLAYGEDRHWEYLADMTDAEWESFHANSIRLKQLADQDRANEAAQAAIEAQRKADEAAKIKADEIARKKAESATDKEKLEEMVKQIQAIVMPTCTSIQGDAIARGAIERLGKLVGHIHEAMQQM